VTKEKAVVDSRFYQACGSCRQLGFGDLAFPGATQHAARPFRSGRCTSRRGSSTPSPSAATLAAALSFAAFEGVRCACVLCHA